MLSVHQWRRGGKREERAEAGFLGAGHTVHRIVGREIRGIKYLHWWTFLSAFYEIGDCTFAQIVRIRNLKAKGKNLDKADQEWYRQNRHLVDFKVKYTEAEETELERWIKARK